MCIRRSLDLESSAPEENGKRKRRTVRTALRFSRLLAHHWRNKYCSCKSWTAAGSLSIYIFGLPGLRSTIKPSGTALGVF